MKVFLKEAEPSSDYLSYAPGRRVIYYPFLKPGDGVPLWGRGSLYLIADADGVQFVDSPFHRWTDETFSHEDMRAVINACAYAQQTLGNNQWGASR